MEEVRFEFYYWHTHTTPKVVWTLDGKEEAEVIRRAETLTGYDRDELRRVLRFMVTCRRKMGFDDMNGQPILIGKRT